MMCYFVSTIRILSKYDPTYKDMIVIKKNVSFYPSHAFIFYYHAFLLCPNLWFIYLIRLILFGLIYFIYCTVQFLPAILWFSYLSMCFLLSISCFSTTCELGTVLKKLISLYTYWLPSLDSFNIDFFFQIHNILLQNYPLF